MGNFKGERRLVKSGGLWHYRKYTKSDTDGMFSLLALVTPSVTNQPAVARAEHNGRINDRSRTNERNKSLSEQKLRDQLVVTMVEQQYDDR